MGCSATFSLVPLVPNVTQLPARNAVRVQIVLNSGSNIYQLAKKGMAMMRKLILGTASVLALGIGGAALDFGADADDASNAVGNMQSVPETSQHWLNAAHLSKDDIR